MTHDTSHTNRLIHESSPYLLQHARNPVDWYPWGDEAFAAAKSQDRPIFLSVGYSACHWCHVMERESFENEDIAAVMNKHFINVKVDREERPDIDSIYMSAVQLMTQRGGWPMSVFLTPQGEPFYGGTYWPPMSRMGMPGFRDILLKLNEVWTQRREEVASSSASLTNSVQQMAAASMERGELGEPLIRQACESLRKSADRTYGGFGGAPKFPHPMDIRILLRGWQRFGDEDALHVAVLTLEKMAMGGMYDHLGGGFHRYSTDARWLVPHFEKMLYDNALLVPAYLEAWQITKRDDFRQVVVETLDYVIREMTHANGGLFSTQDADSEGVEGKFFVWSEEEIVSLLGEERAKVFNYCYDVTERGNWEESNILNKLKTDEQSARILGLELDDLRQTLSDCRRVLLEARSRRIQPGKDEKIITSWNGLMISAMARAGRILGESKYTTAAGNAANFLWLQLRRNTGRWLHTWKDGEAKINAFLDDVACVVDAFIDLFEATGDAGWLGRAVDIAGQVREHYYDSEAGGFYFTPNDHEQLIARNRDFQDSATPSGNGTAATALARLGLLTGNAVWSNLARQTLEAASGLISQHPRAGGQLLIAFDLLLGPTREVVFVEGSQPEVNTSMWRQVQEVFLPRSILICRRQGDASTLLDPAWLEGRTSSGGYPTVYVCQGGACQLPVNDALGLARALGVTGE